MSAQTGKPAYNRLLNDIVNGLIRRHDIDASDLTTLFEGQVVPANEGWKGKVEQIALAKARTLSAETLGRIIFAFPNADLYGVHCGTWLGKYEAGPYLLQQIAATVIVCRIRAELEVSSGFTDYLPFQTGDSA